LLVALAALLLAAAAACEDGPNDGSGTVGTTPTQAPSARSPGEESGLTTVELVEIMAPSVVHIQAGGAVGTGFIIGEEGYIVTNNHVIAARGLPASPITVTLADGRELAARVAGRDERTDVAVLDVDGDGLQAARLGASDDLRVGEEVIAMGHALNLPGGPTVTKGVVSALNRPIEDPAAGISIPDAVQTDASINPGNSGGPLISLRQGTVIGITTAVVRGQAEGIGLAISIDSARPIIEELIERGEVNRGFIGIEIVQAPFAWLQCGLDPTEPGVLIGRVGPDTPAEEADLRPCDLIKRVNESEITSAGDLFRALTEHRAGETVELEYLRNGRTETTEVTLG
jgi:serine protease Do